MLPNLIIVIQLTYYFTLHVHPQSYFARFSLVHWPKKCRSLFTNHSFGIVGVFWTDRRYRMTFDRHWDRASLTEIALCNVWGHSGSKDVNQPQFLPLWRLERTKFLCSKIDSRDSASWLWVSLRIHLKTRSVNGSLEFFLLWNALENRNQFKRN